MAVSYNKRIEVRKASSIIMNSILAQSNLMNDRPVRPARPSQLLARGNTDGQGSYGGASTMLAKLQRSRQGEHSERLEGSGRVLYIKYLLRYGSRRPSGPHHERSCVSSILTKKYYRVRVT